VEAAEVRVWEYFRGRGRFGCFVGKDGSEDARVIAECLVDRACSRLFYCEADSASGSEPRGRELCDNFIQCISALSRVFGMSSTMFEY